MYPIYVLMTTITKMRTFCNFRSKINAGVWPQWKQINGRSKQMERSWWMRGLQIPTENNLCLTYWHNIYPFEGLSPRDSSTTLIWRFILAVAKGKLDVSAATNNRPQQFATLSQVKHYWYRIRSIQILKL